MKNYTSILLLLMPYFTSAQFHLVSKNNDVSNALQQVIEDFPNHFNNIRGEILNQDVQAVNYTSSVNIADADSSVIIQNGSDSDNIYSWNEIVFATDDFDKAKARFHEYFNKIKNTTVEVNTGNVIFNAAYNEPDEGKNFTTILFAGKPETQQLKNVMIDLSLHYIVDGWQVSVSVYEHTDYGVDNNAGN